MSKENKVEEMDLTDLPDKKEDKLFSEHRNSGRIKNGMIVNLIIPFLFLNIQDLHHDGILLPRFPHLTRKLR